jgi:hypothetical protein
MRPEKSDDPPDGCMVAPFPADPADPTVDNASDEVSVASSTMATFTTDPTGGDKAMKKRQHLLLTTQLRTPPMRCRWPRPVATMP